MGKGVASSSIGALLESMGLKVNMIKCDPYINVDAGTQSPYQHGEVFVTDDGAETDLDLGNYERFTKSRLTRANSMTTGQVYESVIRKEREGRYLGRCVQVIPHITDEIKGRIQAIAKAESDTDVVIVEIGGTVGDIESVPFLEAARQLIHESGRTNAISVHLTLIPEVAGNELKTKPTQHSVKSMQEMGIQPDILICRSPVMLDDANRRKIALFTNVDLDAVFTSYNVETTIYEIPIIFHSQKLDQVLLRKIGLENNQANLKSWNMVMERFAARKGKVRIGVVGKYMEIHDAYKSVFEALFHAGLECGVETELVKFDASEIEETENIDTILGQTAHGGGVDGILVPGGFGQRGINGMIKAAAWARTNKIPFLGICLGMHTMVIEWARNVIGWNNADSTEFNPDSKQPVITLLEEHSDNKNYGGTMNDFVTRDEMNYIKGAYAPGVLRLGLNKIIAKDNTRILNAYRDKNIFERHRHRYVFSNQFREDIINSGLIIAAQTPDNNLVECVEWPDHPWGVGVQFHPEFKSKPNQASPLIRDFVMAVKNKKG